MNETPTRPDATSTLLYVVLTALEVDPVIAAAGVFAGVVENRPTPLVHQAVLSDDPRDNLQSEAYRRLTLKVLAVAEDKDGADWMTQATPLKSRIHYALNGKTRADRDRVLATLNMVAQPEDWLITRCAELGGVPPMRAALPGSPSVERWMLGHIYEIYMQRI